jgi:hypothetical protein
MPLPTTNAAAAISNSSPMAIAKALAENLDLLNSQTRLPTANRQKGAREFDNNSDRAPKQNNKFARPHQSTPEPLPGSTGEQAKRKHCPESHQNAGLILVCERSEALRWKPARHRNLANTSNERNCSDQGYSGLRSLDKGRGCMAAIERSKPRTG